MNSALGTGESSEVGTGVGTGMGSLADRPSVGRALESGEGTAVGTAIVGA